MNFFRRLSTSKRRQSDTGTCPNFERNEFGKFSFSLSLLYILFIFYDLLCLFVQGFSNRYFSSTHDQCERKNYSFLPRKKIDIHYEIYIIRMNLFRFMTCKFTLGSHLLNIYKITRQLNVKRHADYHIRDGMSFLNTTYTKSPRL